MLGWWTVLEDLLFIQVESFYFTFPKVFLVFRWESLINVVAKFLILPLFLFFHLLYFFLYVFLECSTRFESWTHLLLLVASKAWLSVHEELLAFWEKYGSYTILPHILWRLEPSRCIHGIFRRFWERKVFECINQVIFFQCLLIILPLTLWFHLGPQVELLLFK